MTRRVVAVVCVWTLPSLICLAATAIVYSAFRIPPAPPLSAEIRARLMAPLRAALADLAGPAGLRPELGEPRERSELAVTVWAHGLAVAQVAGRGADLAAATLDAAEALRRDREVRALSAGERDAARLQVDLIGGHAPIGGHGWLDQLAIPGIGAMLAINPGIEGVAAAVDGRTVRLLPHELVARKLLSAKRPTEAMPELAVGLDLPQIGRLLADRARVLAPVPPGRLVRFRSVAFVEPPDRAGPPLALYRGLPDPPPLTREALREAALRGARYLVAHLAANGRYVYEHDLATGITTDPLIDPATATDELSRRKASYSLPRHAGTTYFLAELYRISHAAWLREPIERAFAQLAGLLAHGGCARTLPDGSVFDCVAERGEAEAHLGSTALSVVALAEYQRATGDRRYLPLARRLARWLLWMQRPDGSFRHVYDVVTRQVKEDAELLYYSGEAALALARMYEITGEPVWALAAIRGLDWLVDWYDFFLGGFFYGEEHWTCIAAEAIWPVSRRPAYRTFCDGYGAFLRAQQAEAAPGSDEADYAGAYNLTPFIAPYNTPAGSRTEAMISAYQLGARHGAPDPALAGQIRAALGYALRQQIRPDSLFGVVGDGDGAMPGAPIDRTIRIDYVQHVCSAMIRASELAALWAP